VAVVIVNWNRKNLLRSCLQSLTTQTLKPFQIILVDNGSTDGSVEMALAEFPAAPLEVVRNQENRGFCAANNQGIALARTPWVALLNNDAEADPDWLQQLVEAGNATGAAMVASKILVHADPSRIDKVGHLIYPDGQNRGRGTGQTDHGQFDRQEEVLWPDGCAALYRRAILEEIGGFDEDFFAYADDAELGMRARRAGYTAVYSPGARVRHHRGTTLGVLSARRIELIERNRILLVVKHFPWSLWWLNGMFYLARLIAGGVAAARGRGETARAPGFRNKLRLATALISGALQAIPLIPKMLRKRWQFRKQCRLKNREVLRLIWRHRISLKEISEQVA
jgi:GT2 family glycosyltransferase